MEIDFSEFHPLDHWPGTRYCRSLPGGTKRHLNYAWHERRKDQILKPWYRIFHCTFGDHKFLIWYHRNKEDKIVITPMCKYCPATRLPSERDIDGIRNIPFI